MEGLFISELSERVEIPAHTIRYYEKIGLISPPKRSQAQYRLYFDDDEARLKFIKQAKLFGFSLEEIKEIIDLRAEGIAPCDHVKELVRKHLHDLDQRISELVIFRDELSQRYKKICDLDEIPAGKICGLIEQEEIE
ncbi:MAG: heavy metal-responsive transcriptional regulator [Dethiobacter sp.]|jgi:DNA-binding transcriptional MerR regulator|nr:heavy metal-responsive transcriptional regulator [Dethiobacter sp.]